MRVKPPIIVGALSPDDLDKPEDVEKAMEGHIVDQAELIGLYSSK